MQKILKKTTAEKQAEFIKREKLVEIEVKYPQKVFDDEGDEICIIYAGGLYHINGKYYARGREL